MPGLLNVTVNVAVPVVSVVAVDDCPVVRSVSVIFTPDTGLPLLSVARTVYVVGVFTLTFVGPDNCKFDTLDVVDPFDFDAKNAIPAIAAIAAVPPTINVVSLFIISSPYCKD